MLRNLVFGLCVLAASLWTSPAAWSQFVDLYDDGPRGMTFAQLSQLSELLGLDATGHELLVAMHTELVQAEMRGKRALLERIEKADEAEEHLDWTERMRWMIDLEKELDGIASRFYEDVALAVTQEQLPLVRHMQHRARMGPVFEMIDDDVSGLSAHPFELLHERKLVDLARFRELVLLHAELDARNGAQFAQTYDTLQKMQLEMMGIGFNMGEQPAQRLAELGRMFTATVEAVRRLRGTNEALAEAILASMTEEERKDFELVWLAANYRDVYWTLPAESAVLKAMEDEDLEGSVRETIGEIQGQFEDRIRIARRMARVAKHRSDLDINFDMILNDKEPDRSAYESSLERIENLGQSYAAALRGVLTAEQRVKYGLERGE